MSLGRGVITSMSQKQKLNTRSSTEAELVILHDDFSRILWKNYFIIAQGYPIDKFHVYQDNQNQSAMLLEINGKDSIGSRTWHMKLSIFCYGQSNE